MKLSFTAPHRLRPAHPDAGIYIYNAKLGRWSYSDAGGDAKTPITVGNAALFAGGINGAGDPLAYVSIFHSRTQRWSQATLSVARYDIAAASVDGEAIFAGGQGP